MSSGETVTQLRPPIDIRTPWGWAMCVGWIDWGPEGEPQWRCIVYDGNRAGHIIDVPQKDCRGGRNYSVHRTETDLPPDPPEMMQKGKRAKPRGDRMRIDDVEERLERKAREEAEIREWEALIALAKAEADG